MWWSTWNKEMQPTVLKRSKSRCQGSQIGSKRMALKCAEALICLLKSGRCELYSQTVPHVFHQFESCVRGVFFLVQYPEQFCLDLRVIRASNHPMRWHLYLKTSMQSIYINFLWPDCESTSCKSSSDSGPHVLSQETLQKCDPETRAAWTLVLLQGWTMPMW